MVCQAQKLILVWVFWLKDEFETAIKCNAVVAKIPESWPLDWLGPILLFEKLNGKMNDASRLQTNPLASLLPPLWPPPPFTPSPPPSSNAFGTICNCAHNSTADSIHLIRIHVFVIPSLSSLADFWFFFLVRFDFSFIHSYLSSWKITFHSSVPYLHDLIETLCTQLLPPMYCLP